MMQDLSKKPLPGAVQHTPAKLTTHAEPLWWFVYHPDNGTVMATGRIGPADGHKTLDDIAKEYAGMDAEVVPDTSGINTLGDFRVCFTDDPKRFFESCITAQSYNYVEEA